jgi:hypothetical protein
VGPAGSRGTRLPPPNPGNPLHYERLLRFSRRSVIAVAAAGLLLPERFRRCCSQPGYRSGATRAEPAAILGLRRYTARAARKT